MNKPIFSIGDNVSAEWSPGNDSIGATYKGGVIKSKRGIKTTYGACQIYTVDNGVTRENIGDYQVDHYPVADWMGSSTWIGLDGFIKRNAPPKGVKHVCDKDKDSSDQWARGIGW